MSKRLSTCIGSTKSMHRINFSLFRITLCGNNCKQLHLFHALRGETSRDLIYSFRVCYENCMHRRTCVVSKCVVVWKTVPFHDEKLMKNTLYIPETIPSRTETRKSDEGFLRKITDFRDYCLFVCLFVIVWRAPLIERAERTGWSNVFTTEVVTAVNNHNKLYATA